MKTVGSIKILYPLEEHDDHVVTRECPVQGDKWPDVG